MRRLAFAVVALAACSVPARADTLPLITDLPATYTPGEAFTFKVSVPTLFDFTNYTLQLVFTTDPINPPLFASASAAASNYVYPSSAGFQSTLSTVLDSNEVILTLSDSTTPGVEVVPGTNDQIATVTVTPGLSLTGPIRLSIGVDSLFDYNKENGEVPLLTGIPPIEQSTPPGPVPAPAGAVLLGSGLLLLGLRARLRRASV